MELFRITGVVAGLYLAMILSPVAQASDTACPLPAASGYKETESIEYLFFDIDGKSAASTRQPDDPMLVDYQRWVNSKTDSNPYYLLRHQRQIFSKAFGEGSGTVKLFDLIINKQIGTIGSAKCLETVLFAIHNTKHPLKGLAGEFTALIYQKDGFYKAILALAKKPWMGGPSMDQVSEESNQLLAEGWRPAVFLHNHPFSFDNPYGDIAGTLIPSDPDIQSFIYLHQSMGLEEAWITNGIDTIRYKSPEFQQLYRCCHD